MSILMASCQFQLYEPIRYAHESYDTFSLKRTNQTWISREKFALRIQHVSFGP